MAITGISQNIANSIHGAHGNLTRQISTGTRYSTAADNPSAYSIDIRMNSNIGAISQSNENTQKSNSMLKVAAGGVESTVSSLSSLREGIINALNDTNTTGDRNTLSQLAGQAIQTVNDNSSVRYNGMALLDGSKSSGVFVSSDTGAKHAVSLGDMGSTALGLTDAQGRMTLDFSSRDGLNAALETVDNALNAALDQATTIGAAQQGLNYQSANYTVTEENTLGASTTMNGTDIAKAATKLKQNDVLQQTWIAAQRMQMDSMTSRYSALGLLR
ncbi:flagellin [Selenomonas sp. TAMA-11512]|uniref:flagellin n=1 Tax=Selenomonas sp. TAMA-11512 TaxID=3095337 RepID=UPI00308BE6AD|nr:flagellin [Selenomonas sp. TAMA-11512]